MTRLTKRIGTLEEFQRSKVEGSLRRSGATDDVISKTVQRVTPVDEGERTSAFRTRISTELKSQSPETARRYENSRRLMAGRSQTVTEGTAQVNPATLRSYGWKPGETVKVRHDDKSLSVKVEESAQADLRAVQFNSRTLTDLGVSEGTRVCLSKNR
jgi:hypothetical protein